MPSRENDNGDHDGDFVDHVRRQWADTYPDVDAEPIEVLGRITRVGTLALHQLDRLGLPAIYAEPVPEEGLGRAIMDRLRRATVRD